MEAPGAIWCPEACGIWFWLLDACVWLLDGLRGVFELLWADASLAVSAAAPINTTAEKTIMFLGRIGTFLLVGHSQR
jgi:hypothetical protein